MRSKVGSVRSGVGASHTPFLIVLILAVAVTPLTMWLIFGVQSDAPQNRVLQSLQERYSPEAVVNNRLNARYQDENVDLIADAPASGEATLDPDVLTFSYVPTDDPSAYENVFVDLTTRLAKATGREVRYVPFTSLDEQLRALGRGELHLAGLNTGAVPIAVNECGFVPIANLGNDAGTSTYTSMIIARKNSGITQPRDLEGKDVTFTSYGSNSGFKAPMVLLRDDHGLQVFRDYNPQMSNGHQQSIRGMAAGTYDVIAVASDLLEREIAAGTLSRDDFVVVKESSPFPVATIGHIHNLEPSLAAKIKAALLDYSMAGTSEGTYFAQSGQTRFVDVNYKDEFDAVRLIDNQAGFKHEVNLADRPADASPAEPADAEVDADADAAAEPEADPA
ncbi:MAG: phosphate/phosphite/phosphonate ABC transporter substrate-binding protein [Phycisphaerae bacterium]